MEFTEYYDSEDEGSYEYSNDNNWSHGESERELYSHESNYGNQPWYYEDCSSYNYGEEQDGEEFEPEPPDRYTNKLQTETTCIKTNSSFYEDETDEEYEEEYLYNNPPRREEKPYPYEEVHSDDESKHYMESNQEDNSWGEETDSNISLEEKNHEDEPEQGEFNDEESFVEPYERDRPWCEENDSQTSEGEAEHHEDEPWNHEIGPEDSYGVEYVYGSRREEADYDNSFGEKLERDGEESELDGEFGEQEDSRAVHEEPEYEEEYGDESGVVNEAEEDEPGDDSMIEEEDHEPRYIIFSGHSQGPEAYLQWEQDMENWFSSNQIAEEEKTSCAEETLTEDAFRHWERDAYYRLEYGALDATWEKMKQLLRDEFVKDAAGQIQYGVKIYTNPKPRRWILATRPKPKDKPKKAYYPEPRKVSHHIPKDSSNTLKEKIEAKQPAKVKEVQADPAQPTLARKLNKRSLSEPHGKIEQCKSSSISKVSDTICYRCHKSGHYAATCPTRKVLISTSLESPNILKKTTEAKQTVQAKGVQQKPNQTCMLKHQAKHLQGIKETQSDQKEELKRNMLADQRRNQDDPPPMLFKPASKNEECFLDTMLLKEEPPDAQTKIQGLQVLRSKLLEEGGYDEVIRPVAESELHQSVFDNRLESSQDICAFEGVYQTNQKELSNKQTYSRNLTQQGSCSKLNQHNRSSDEGVIQFTNRVISNLPDLDIGVLIGDFRPSQEEISYEPTCYGICIHQRLLENWNHTKIGFGLKVIQFLNQWFLGLPYLESHEFGQDQTYSWRPGDLSNDLQASQKSLQCSSTQRIRRILLYLNLPYLDVFTHKVLKHQQLFPYQSCCVLRLDTMHLDIPRHHLFTPKLSRLKRRSIYQIWWSVCTLFPSLWFCPNGFSKGGF